MRERYKVTVLITRTKIMDIDAHSEESAIAITEGIIDNWDNIEEFEVTGAELA